MSRDIARPNTIGSLVYVTGVGVISPAGSGMDAIQQAIQHNLQCFEPLTLFDTGQAPPKPVGQVADELLQPELDQGLPRTHVLALRAAEMALGSRSKPQALIIGCTTGGMKTTEELLLGQPAGSRPCIATMQPETSLRQSQDACSSTVRRSAYRPLVHQRRWP